MLLQFTVNNYRSIKDTVIFSMKTASKDEKNSFIIRDYELLQSAVVYGANASGKSNLLKAMATMRNIILNQTKVSQSTDRLPYEPFKLNSETEDASSSFEIVFFYENIKYRYGFEADAGAVYAEWLFSDEKGKESKLFYRDVDEGFYVNPTRFREGKGLEKKTLPNQLFLWKCDSENGVISQKILRWFLQFNMIDGLENTGYIDYTKQQLKNEDFKNDIVSLVRIADLGIKDISTDEIEASKELLEKIPLPQSLKDELLQQERLMQIDTKTVHQKFDKFNNPVSVVSFELNQEESVGTQKFFAMSAPILDTLKNGKVLMIDELDASLHPMLTIHLVKMFHNKRINTKNAQLIFATHDTNLLYGDLFRRDQVWFTEKDRYGATDIYSLIEYKKNPTRKESNKEKNYLQGRYGAIPYLSEFAFENK
jgi:AAA15 family ATPase/GTPase